MKSNIETDPSQSVLEALEDSNLSTSSDRILVVDDDPEILDFLCRVLQSKGFEVSRASEFSEASSLLDTVGFSLVLTDLSLPDGSGIDLINQAHERDTQIVCILITGYGTMESVIDAIHASVYDYLPKPFDVKQLLSTVHNGLEKRNLEIANRRLLEELRSERESLKRRVESATRDLQTQLKEVQGLKKEITVLFEIMRDIRGDVRISESLKRFVEYLGRAIDFESSFWVVTDLADQLISAGDWEHGPSRHFDLKDLSPSQLEEFRNACPIQ